MPNPPIEPLRRQLLRGGFSPRYVRRYCDELSDHYYMAVQENQSAGLMPEDVALDACRQLGDQETLFQSVAEHTDTLAFARRYSAVMFLLLPLPTLLAAKFLFVSIWVLAGFVASQLSDSAIVWMNLHRPTAHTALDYAAPLIVAILYFVLACRRGCGRSWPFLSAGLISFVAGCLQLEMRQPVFDIGFVQAGAGVISFAVTPIAMVPILVCVVFLTLRRCVTATSNA